MALRYHHANTRPRAHREEGILKLTSAAVPRGRLRVLLTAFLSLLLAVMVVQTIHWPWTNDAQVFHYAIFLMGRGLAPYRQIVDLNLPGSYLSEWVGMHLAASSNLSYRLYDLLLLLLFGWAATVIARPYNWFAGILAGSLFALVHASEGAWMMGERDLVMAVLLAGAYALTMSATRSAANLRQLFLAGFLLALACTLKPFALLYVLPLLPLVLRRSHPGRSIGSLAAAFALVAAFTVAFLLWRHSFAAFLHGTLMLATAYGGTNRAGIGYMLHHSTPRGLFLLLPLALPLAVIRRSWRDSRVLSLQLAILLGLLSYFAQGKGFIYHRYPWVAFALLWLSVECTGALPAQSGSKPKVGARLLASATLVSALLVAAFYLHRTFHMPPDDRMATSIAADLQTLEQKGTPLDNHVQCLDGITGCYSALYRLQLASSTGFLGDQLLFQQKATPAVQQARALFQQQLQANPPSVFIETNYWYGGPQQFSKTATWPAFDGWLHSRYTLVHTHTFPEHPDDIDPIGYQIYVRHP